MVKRFKNSVLLPVTPASIKLAVNSFKVIRESLFLSKWSKISLAIEILFPVILCLLFSKLSSRVLMA